MLNLFKLLDTIFYSIYPQICINCKKMLKTGEEHICFSCYLKIPINHYSWENPSSNLITNKFEHILPIQYGLSFFFFERSSVVQKIIHQLKYNSKEEIGTWVVEHFIHQFPTFCLSDIDEIIGVPLHSRRKKERGYNQVDLLCTALSKYSGVNYSDDIVKRIKYTTSQTQKNREERLKSMVAVFQSDYHDRIKGKHLLIVDDVLTTGATIQALGQKLHELGATRISILTIAVVV